jgi:hypothetical protein
LLFIDLSSTLNNVSEVLLHRDAKLLKEKLERVLQSSFAGDVSAFVLVIENFFEFFL